MFSDLNEFGGENYLANRKIFLMICLLGHVTLVLRCFASLSSLAILLILASISVFLLILMLVIFSGKWMQYIREKLANNSLSLADIIFLGSFPLPYVCHCIKAGVWCADRCLLYLCRPDCACFERSFMSLCHDT